MEHALVVLVVVLYVKLVMQDLKSVSNAKKDIIGMRAIAIVM
jgi:hypothetical protein